VIQRENEYGHGSDIKHEGCRVCSFVSESCMGFVLV